MTVKPVIVDPDYISLEILTSIKFNPNKTIQSQSDIEGLVKSAVTAYVNSISTFNSDYLESKLSSTISDIGSGIVSVGIDTHVGFRISPIIGIETSHTKTLANAIVAGTIESTKFNIIHNGSSLTVNILEIPNSTTILTTTSTSQSVVVLGLYSVDGTLIKPIGTANLDTGEITFAIGLYSYISASGFIHVKCKLKNKDIILTRNKILMFDPIPSDSVIGLLDNNRVSTEIYVK
jgi:hypothetical protein